MNLKFLSKVLLVDYKITVDLWCGKVNDRHEAKEAEESNRRD
jgi:hypothetical protein